MAKKWKDIDLDKIMEDAKSKTDSKLASEISSISKLSDADIKKLFPEKASAAAFIELMTIVKSSDDRNKKINRIVENGKKFGGIVLDLLGKLV